MMGGVSLTDLQGVQCNRFLWSLFRFLVKLYFCFDVPMCDLVQVFSDFKRAMLTATSTCRN